MNQTKPTNQTTKEEKMDQTIQITKCPPRVAKGVKTQAMPDGNPKTDPEPKRKAKAAKSKAKASDPKAQAKAKPVPKREGSMAEFIDGLMQEGTTWNDLLKAAEAEAKKRGVSTLASLSQLKQHARFRAKSPKWKVTISDKRVKMEPKEE